MPTGKQQTRTHLLTPLSLTACGIQSINLWRGVLTEKLADVTCRNCIKRAARDAPLLQAVAHG